MLIRLQNQVFEIVMNIMLRSADLCGQKLNACLFMQDDDIAARFSIVCERGVYMFIVKCQWMFCVLRCVD